MPETNGKKRKPIKYNNNNKNTYREGSAASASAAPLPLMPTAIPQTRLQPPTVRPDQKSA